MDSGSGRGFRGGMLRLRARWRRRGKGDGKGGVSPTSLNWELPPPAPVGTREPWQGVCEKVASKSEGRPHMVTVPDFAREARFSRQWVAT